MRNNINDNSILIVMMIPLYNNASGNMRLLGLLKGASEIGYNCDLLTMKAEHDDAAYDDFFSSIEMTSVRNYYTFESTKLYKKTKENNKRSSLKCKIRDLLKKVYLFFSVYEASAVNVKNALAVPIDYSQYKYIISFSDPKSTHKIIKELIASHKINDCRNKWIQYWGDPWFIDSTRNYAFGGLLVKREEQAIIDLAYRVIYTSPFTLEKQAALFPTYSSKMKCVNQATIIHDKKYDNIILEQIILGYFGQYLKNVRDIMPLYRCCVKYKYKINIAGNSDVFLAEKGNVKIFPRLSVQKINQMEREANILVCICNKSGTQIPGKLYYQAGYQKPIIVILDGDQKDILKEYFKGFHRFILCDNTIEDIRNAIEKAVKEIHSKTEYVLDERLRPAFCAKEIIE